MPGAIENLVICAPNRQAVVPWLRDLGIQPHAFMRRRVWVVTGPSDLQHVRGLHSMAWTVVPRHVPEPIVMDTLAAQTRDLSRCAVSWHEAIARFLAWRIYHEC